MRAIPAIALLAAVSALASSPVAPPDTASVRSKSGQFVVYAGRLPPAPPAPPNLVTNVDYAELEASLVAVSCERIKQALWTELELSGQWSGKVHLTLLPVQGEDDPVTIVSERFPKGWGYRVELPQFVRRERFVRAIVQTLLHERANRQGPVRSADIPFWLTEGLTRHLLGSQPSELILTNPRWKLRGLELNPVVLDERRRDPLELAREEPKVAMPIGQEVIFVDPEYSTTRWLGFKGVVKANPFYQICRSQQDVEIEGDWARLRQEARDSHWMMVYGDYLREVGYALKRVGIAWDRLA